MRPDRRIRRRPTAASASEEWGKRVAQTASDLGMRRLIRCGNDLLSLGYPWWDARSGRKIGGGRCTLTPTRGAGNNGPVSTAMGVQFPERGWRDSGAGGSCVKVSAADEGSAGD